MNDVKHVAYAYPSSDLAKTMNRRDGCYAVIIGRPSAVARDVYGPFDTVEDAESAAQGHPVEWWGLYIRYPLLGSQFNEEE